MHTALDLEKPRLVSIETTNRCNAHCSFCPNNALARERLTMDQALFEKIIEDCQQFPLPAIEPFLNGDPFMDPDIVGRMFYIRERLPKTKLRLYTNGSLMTSTKLDQMEGLGIDHLFISLNTLNPDDYRRILRLNLENTKTNIEALATRATRRGIARQVTVRMTRFDHTTLQEQDDFLAYCKKLNVNPMIVGLFNYKGDIPSNYPVPPYPCEHITRLDILSSGRVTLCCLDQEGEYSWGDIRESNVLDVFNGAKARYYKTRHRSGLRKKTPPCGQCNLFWPSFSQMTPLRTLQVMFQCSSYFLRYRPNGRKAPSIKEAP